MDQVHALMWSAHAAYATYSHYDASNTEWPNPPRTSRGKELFTHKKKQTHLKLQQQHRFKQGEGQTRSH